MLAVHLGMRVHRNVAAIGVLPRDHHAATITHQIERLRERPRVAGGLDDQIHAAAIGQRAHVIHPLLVRYVEIEHVCRAHRFRELEASGRRTDHHHRMSARQPCQRRRRDPHWAGTQHRHRVPEANVAALHRMNTRDEAAATGDKERGIHALREAQELHAGLHPDVIRPSAKRSIGHAVRDAVDLSLRAARGLFGDETLVAPSTRFMHIEKGDQVAFLERLAVYIAQFTANGGDLADRHMPRDDRIRHPAQPAVMQMDVGTAHLRKAGAQHRAAGFEPGPRQFTELNRSPWRRHHSGANDVSHMPSELVERTTCSRAA